MESPPNCAVALVPYYPGRGPTFGDQAVAFPWETPVESPPNCAVALVPSRLLLGGMGTNVAGIKP